MRTTRVPFVRPFQTLNTTQNSLYIFFFYIFFFYKKSFQSQNGYFQNSNWAPPVVATCMLSHMQHAWQYRAQLRAAFSRTSSGPAVDVRTKDFPCAVPVRAWNIWRTRAGPACFASAAAMLRNAERADYGTSGRAVFGRRRDAIGELLYLLADIPPYQQFGVKSRLLSYIQLDNMASMHQPVCNKSHPTPANAGTRPRCTMLTAPGSRGYGSPASKKITCLALRTIKGHRTRIRESPP